MILEKNNVYIDMWFRNTPEEADKITISFYPNDCKYRGNIYKDGKIIGGYVCSDSLALEKAFPQLQFNLDFDWD